MKDIKVIKNDFSKAIESINTLVEIEDLRIEYTGKKGLIKTLFAELQNAPSDERSKLAKGYNEFKDYVETSLQLIKEKIQNKELDKQIQKEWLDLSLPGTIDEKGALHPLTIIERNCIDVLSRLGFILEDGPEVETPFHTFDALNMPEYHPARDMQDTFWLENNFLLRSHTSTVQIRVLEKTTKFPIKIISPGRVYRNEKVDATHLACFHQFEGLWVEQDIKFSHLIGTIKFIIKNIFGEEWDYRIKPKYYPYTEPSIGVDIRKKNTKNKWITILGAGMVHSNVFKATGHNPERISGFAFGLGVSRMVTMAHHVTNMKSLYEGDLRVHRGIAKKHFN